MRTFEKSLTLRHATITAIWIVMLTAWIPGCLATLLWGNATTSSWVISAGIGIALLASVAFGFVASSTGVARFLPIAIVLATVALSVWYLIVWLTLTTLDPSQNTSPIEGLSFFIPPSVLGLAAALFLGVAVEEARTERRSVST